MLDHLEVPLRIVILAGRGDGGLRFGGGLLGHKVSKEGRMEEGQERRAKPHRVRARAGAGARTKARKVQSVIG
jgi:hypothetical protein